MTENEPKCITVAAQAESMKAMAISQAKAAELGRKPIGIDTITVGSGAKGSILPGHENDAMSLEITDKTVLVLHITTSFGKRYTCRTVEELENYIDNIKKEKKLKRDEDVDIQIGFGRMTKTAYDALPACKYFVKT